MCEVMQKYQELAVKKDRIERIQAMLKEGFDKTTILKVGYAEEEYLEAEEALCMNA